MIITDNLILQKYYPAREVSFLFCWRERIISSRFWVGIVSLLLIFLTPIEGKAKTLKVPIFLSFPLVQQILLKEIFTRPNGTTQYTLDQTGCSKIIFSDPDVTSKNGLLKISTHTKAIISVSASAECTTLTKWEGKTVVIGKPVVVKDKPAVIDLDLKSAKIYDQRNHLILEGMVYEILEEQIKTFLSEFVIDLKPSIHHAKQLFPSLLPRTTKAELDKLINSIQLHSITTEHEGIKATFTLEHASRNLRTTPPVRPLTQSELTALEKKWKTWDAFLTFVVKQAAATTQSAKIRSSLLNVLLDARYQFQASLLEASTTGQDPIKQLFLRSWNQLEPVLRQISQKTKNTNLLPLLSFMTAGEALNILEEIGPELGLEISEEGLKRLARLINDNPSIDPLEYLQKIDPEMQQLFGLGRAGESKATSPPLGLNLGLMSLARADSNWDKIQPWLPPSGNINKYLTKVSHLLLEKAKHRLYGTTLSPDIQNVYRYLTLTTAWQESCWRQFVIHQQKAMPLKSTTGDVGLFQINERVWRGFYNLQKLRWDIAYNAASGSEILYRYLIKYALKNNEHQQMGGLDNLARSSYSAYNGGPSQLDRYRSGNAKARLKAIDQSFWEKYQQVKESHELDVASCFGGSKTSPKNSSNFDKLTPITQPKTKARQSSSTISTTAWILSRNPDHFTLQLAALHVEKNIQSFITTLRQPGKYAYFHDNLDKEGLFRIIFGSFESKAEAEQYARRFRTIKPWVRSFNSIQKNLKK